jgi:hypothetical protein
MAQESDTDVDLEIEHLSDEGRYEASVEGGVVAVAQYRDEGEAVAFLHTRTMSGFERRGIATKLVEHVLGDMAAQEKKVLPYCWFVGDVMKRRPELAELVPAEERPKFGL